MVKWLCSLTRCDLRSAGHPQWHVRKYDPWDEWLDTDAAYAALAHLPVPQRAALTLRYLDGLSVADVAEHLRRTVHGTETLLARSRAALRREYEEGHHHAR